MEAEHSTFTVFVGHRLAGRGPLLEAVRCAKEQVDSGILERIALFEDARGRAIDIDYRGTVDEVLARLADHPLLGDRAKVAQQPRGPGRPKLGVVSREVSLLPRHWEWLGEQRGGASATIRRLVEAAKRESQAGEHARRARDACYGFMSDMAGDLPGFEEASRAFYAGNDIAFRDCIAAWPEDLRAHVERMLDDALHLEDLAAR